MKIILLFLVFATLQIHAQEIKSLNFDIRIDVENSTVSVDGYADVDFKGNDSINLVLWKNTQINGINISEKAAHFVFDSLSPSPAMYIPGGCRLTIYRSTEAEQLQKIDLKYVCNMKGLQGWANSFSKEWIELNFYCAWFPVHSQERNAPAEFRIYVDDNFSVNGSGTVQKKDNYWEFKQSGDSFDNVLIVSESLQSKILDEGGSRVEAIYNGKEFSNEDADSVLTECKYIMALFENCFGKNDSAYVKFVISPFEKGGGYSRRNFVCLRTKQYSKTLAQGIAHEISHFWWNKASALTWEDWLNESFAEYSMLMYIKDRYGREEFMKKIKTYQADIRNMGANIPAVWGINRNSSEAYTILYENGSLILCELEEMIGKKKFIGLLKQAAINKISFTKDFLDLVENSISYETRYWLEARLKAEN